MRKKEKRRQEVKVIPFHREHLQLMEMRSYEKENLLPFFSEPFYRLAEESLHCYTLIKDGRVITCAGLFPLWNGVYECWQIPSIYVSKYMLEYCRDIKTWLDTLAGRLNIWRVQTYSPADDLHDRWMKFLLFECEGTLKEYSRFKIDYRIWARRYNHGC